MRGERVDDERWSQESWRQLSLSGGDEQGSYEALVSEMLSVEILVVFEMLVEDDQG